MTIIRRIGSWTYEVKNVFLNLKQIHRTTLAGIKFTPVRDSKRKERVFEEKLCFAQGMRMSCRVLVVGAFLTGIKGKGIQVSRF